MNFEKNKSKYAIVLIFIFALGFSLFINLPKLQKHFLFADEATYYSLTQSIAHDGDIEYTQKDLIRYTQTISSEPVGIFLKKGKDNKIFFAKSFAYPVFAALFVKIFGINGFLVFHSVLFLLFMIMGYTFLSRFHIPSLSLLSLLTFFFASITFVYYFWISPDFFNFILVFSVLFLWSFKYIHKENKDEQSSNNKIFNFLLSDWSDYLAAFLAGIAVFSKPPNIVLMIPIVLGALFNKRILKSFLVIVIFVLVSGLFWGSNHHITGEWNYQGGERKEFFGPFPFEKEDITFDSIKRGAAELTSKDYAKKHILPPNLIPYNLFYYFFGRFTGVTWYFFPAFLFLILFFIRKKILFQWLIFIALIAEIFIYIILMPDNYAGGGGGLANRYFLNIFPLFFFLPGGKRNLKEIALCWLIASVFISQILVSPILHSHYPDTHVKKFPFKMLPVEMTLVNNFPTNTNPEAFRKRVGDKAWIHFLDDNFHPKHPGEPGFWTRGPHQAEMILKTYYPVEKIDILLHNNPRMKNKITVTVRRQKKKITLSSKQNSKLSFYSPKAFHIGKWIHLYKIKIKAEKGASPYYEESRSMEKRYLGVRFKMNIQRKK